MNNCLVAGAGLNSSFVIFPPACTAVALSIPGACVAEAFTEILVNGVGTCSDVFRFLSVDH